MADRLLSHSHGRAIMNIWTKLKKGKNYDPNERTQEMKVSELIKELKRMKKAANADIPVLFFSNGYKTPEVSLSNAGNDFEDKWCVVFSGKERLPESTRESIICKS